VNTISMDIDASGHSPYDKMIEDWNRVHPKIRSQRFDTCRHKGHEYADVLSKGEVVYTLCIRCFQYAPVEPSKPKRAHVVVVRRGP
jgi:hypothetical protein